MDATERVERALDEALAAASSDAPTSSIVRSALRVAVLRQDALAEFWLYLEVEGLTKSTAKSERQIDAVRRHTASVGDQAESQRLTVVNAFMARREVGDGKKFMSHGVAEIEANNATMRKLYDEPITPGMTPLDTGLASIDRGKMRATLMPNLVQAGGILARIREAAYTYLLGVETELLNGKTLPDVVAQGRAFVDSELSRLAPEALAALNSAQERLAQGDPEAMSHAATSCRRAIKAMADTLYPPGEPVIGDDGASRTMDDEHYRNRLTEYVRQKRGRSTHADLLASNLVSLGNRLKSLDDLASKGVHAAVSKSQAESCVTWTYMLAADLLRIEEEQSSSRGETTP